SGGGSKPPDVADRVDDDRFPSAAYVRHAAPSANHIWDTGAVHCPRSPQCRDQTRKSSPSVPPSTSGMGTESSPQIASGSTSQSEEFTFSISAVKMLVPVGSTSTAASVQKSPSNASERTGCSADSLRVSSDMCHDLRVRCFAV